MSATAIQWTDRTLNPLRYGRGHFCQKISPGCANCYASRMQPRFRNPAFPGTGGDVPPIGDADAGVNSGKLWLDTRRLHEVLTRKVPTRYFWCDMTDIFSPWWPAEWLDYCFVAMALTPRHTHQVLTKRPARAREYLLSRGGRGGLQALERAARAMGYTTEFDGRPLVNWPLPNVWLGISAEDQMRADERNKVLQQTPAAVRFWSAEPLLGPVEMRPFCPACLMHCLETAGRSRCCDMPVRYPDWVIVGGESGPGARPCQLNHVRGLVQQCAGLGVPCFVKQLGSVPRAETHDDLRLLGSGCHRLMRDRKGGNPDEWPEDLRVRQWPGRGRALPAPTG